MFPDPLWCSMPLIFNDSISYNDSALIKDHHTDCKQASSVAATVFLGKRKSVDIYICNVTTAGLSLRLDKSFHVYGDIYVINLSAGFLCLTVKIAGLFMTYNHVLF